MADFQLESWEREPLWLKLITPFLKKKRCPTLVGNPKKGKWYRIYPEGYVDANGERTHANFQLGLERKMLVFFCGGGVSWNEYTAARQISLYSKDAMAGFYMVHTELFSDLILNKGIFENSSRNPFRNWSKLILNYNTGDFHAGNGDFPYTALDGSKRILHHHGFRNYRAIISQVKKWIPNPEQLLISGCSAGAFGVALLSNDIIHQFPNCENVTCLVDSGFIRMKNWFEVAKNVWDAPAEIIDCVHSDNIMLDGLSALYLEHGNRVKYLFSCSIRDGALARMKKYIEHGIFAFTQEAGDEIEKEIRQLCEELREKIPEIGLYIFDKLDKKQKSSKLTIHCIIGEKDVYEHITDGKTAIEWIENAVNGKVERLCV